MVCKGITFFLIINMVVLIFFTDAADYKLPSVFSMISKLSGCFY